MKKKISISIEESTIKKINEYNKYNLSLSKVIDIIITNYLSYKNKSAKKITQEPEPEPEVDLEELLRDIGNL